MKSCMNCDEFVRAFIAVEITDEIRRNISSLQSDLRDIRADVRWVKPENTHLTLIFLGDISGENAAEVAGVMDKVVRGRPPFGCEVAGLGFFGRPDAPRVLWAGIDGNIPALKDMQAGLASALAELGLKMENRPYLPHLTIGRVRSKKGAGELINAWKTRKDDRLGGFEIARVLLIKSELSPQGPNYAILHESALRPD